MPFLGEEPLDKNKSRTRQLVYDDLEFRIYWPRCGERSRLSMTIRTTGNDTTGNEWESLPDTSGYILTTYWAKDLSAGAFECVCTVEDITRLVVPEQVASIKLTWKEECLQKPVF